MNGRKSKKNISETFCITLDIQLRKLAKLAECRQSEHPDFAFGLRAHDGEWSLVSR